MHLRIFVTLPFLYNAKWNNCKILNITQTSNIKWHFLRSRGHCLKCLRSKFCLDIGNECILTIHNREVSGMKRKLALRSSIFLRKESLNRTVQIPQPHWCKRINPTSRRDKQKREGYCVKIKSNYKLDVYSLLKFPSSGTNLHFQTQCCQHSTCASSYFLKSQLEFHSWFHLPVVWKGVKISNEITSN